MFLEFGIESQPPTLETSAVQSEKGELLTFHSDAYVTNCY